MKLTSDNVRKIFKDCLFKDEENKDNYIIGEGVNLKAGFHPERLEKNKENIISMLNELPDSFKKSKGGGMSFLNMCEDKNGYQWGEHENMDQLVVLGNSINKITFLMPKKMWSVFPGGMPYLSVE